MRTAPGLFSSVLALLVTASCARTSAPEVDARRSESKSTVGTGTGIEGESKAFAGTPDASATTPPGDAATKAPEVFRDPDGNDEPRPETPGSGVLPQSGSLVAVGKPPLGLEHVCDISAFGNKLYLAHANRPLGSDGATITTYDPTDEKKPFAVAFDWNRAGEPTKGGGGGQGFLRVHAIDGRLWVPDADPPYGGLGAADWGTEGYVFVSNHEGAFARARYPHAGLPGLPGAGLEGKAGASVLPRAYHVLDVVKFRGHLYASTGSVPPDARAWNGPSPGALHVAKDDLSRFTYALGFPSPYPGGVWRLTYMTRFRDRLYAGIQDYDGVSPDDYVVFTLPEGHDVLTERDAAGVRVTEHGAAWTLRWYADRGALYWIAGTAGGTVTLRKTTDGSTWQEIALPAELGRPSDIVRFRGHLVVLGERGLAALEEGGAAHMVAAVTQKKSPFVIDDILCAPPLEVLGDTLYLGGHDRGATLYRLE
jgi:hypothetical protein